MAYRGTCCIEIPCWGPFDEGCVGWR